MLNSKQVTTIIINAITVKMLITFPKNAISLCGNAAWISALYCTLVAAAIFFITIKIYNSERNVIQIAEAAFGPFMRTVTGIVVFVVLASNFFTVMRIFPETIRLVLLQRTHVELIYAVFAAALVLGAFCGVEAIGRVHGLFIPVAGGIFVVFVFLLFPSMNPENVMPILGRGPQSLFIKNLPFLSLFSDLLLLNMLMPYVENKDEYKRSGLKALFIGGAVSIVIFAVYAMSYAYPSSEKLLFPVYQLERLIRLSNFFSRFEAIFQFIWTITILIYGSLYLSVLAEVWQVSFKLKRKEPLILPITVILVAISLIPDNLAEMINCEGVINMWIYIPALAIPIIFGIIGRLRGK